MKYTYLYRSIEKDQIAFVSGEDSDTLRGLADELHSDLVGKEIHFSETLNIQLGDDMTTLFFVQDSLIHSGHIQWAMDYLHHSQNQPKPPVKGNGNGI